MGNYSEEDGDQFFDAREEISSVSDCSSDCFDDFNFEFMDSLKYDFWTRNLESVHNRRRRFMECMGVRLDNNLITRVDSNIISNQIQLIADRITENSGAVLRTSGLGDQLSIDQSSLSSWSTSTHKSISNDVLGDNVQDLMEFTIESSQSEIPNNRSESGSNQSVSFEEFQRSTPSSPSFQQHLCTQVDETRNSVGAKGKMKKGWLRKLGAMTHILERHKDAATENCKRESTSRARMKTVHVQPRKKRSKELSSLYVGQDFKAHEGSILTMKFSLDGRYLASAGEDCIIRVWKIIEDERAEKVDMPETDSPSLCFTMNHLSQLAPFDNDDEKIDKKKRFRRASDSTCVILPPKVFRILEKPLNEFQGHQGEIVDLCWSKKGFLLSSSVDMTVRLWQVGYDRCLGVFSHNNYVTCVAFNPVNDNYFISGSIDGKVRIWEVLGCRVVDYLDIKEIVTAVCYHPDGKGAIVGAMTGNCCIYDVVDNRLQLDAQISLQGKKKLPGKRITGFQFSPSDPDQVMVTSADSNIRILSGGDVICKFRASGLRIAASPIFANFSSDGKHIVSASEDCNVYVWNYSGQEKTSSRVKNIWSCESFVSHDSSVAIPWHGIEMIPGTLPSPTLGGVIDNGPKHPQSLIGELDEKISHFSSDCFSLTRGFLLESLMKGSSTWPEESLPDSGSSVSVPPAMCKSRLKILKRACQNTLSSPHMWGFVVVVATWDGRIRAYHNYGLPVHL